MLVFRFKKLHNIAENNSMQPLYKNEKLLFKGFQDFLLQKQHILENRLPYYLLWVSRFHEFCSRSDIDGDSREVFTTNLQDLVKQHEGMISVSTHFNVK